MWLRGIILWLIGARCILTSSLDPESSIDFGAPKAWYRHGYMCVIYSPLLARHLHV